MKFIFSSHALAQMKVRHINIRTVRRILEFPQQVITQNGKKIYQSIIEETGGRYLIRIFVNHKKNPNVVITVYRTSKVKKYYES